MFVITPLPLLPSLGFNTNGKPIFFTNSIILESSSSSVKFLPSGIGTLFLDRYLYVLGFSLQILIACFVTLSPRDTVKKCSRSSLLKENRIDGGIATPGL